MNLIKKKPPIFMIDGFFPGNYFEMASNSARASL